MIEFMQSHINCWASVRRWVIGEFFSNAHLPIKKMQPVGECRLIASGEHLREYYCYCDARRG